MGARGFECPKGFSEEGGGAICDYEIVSFFGAKYSPYSCHSNMIPTHNSDRLIEGLFIPPIYDDRACEYEILLASLWLNRSGYRGIANGC